MVDRWCCSSPCSTSSCCTPDTRRRAPKRSRSSQDAGGFIGNGDDEPWEAEGVGGVSLAQGGDGTRERRYLETLELGIRQTIRHAQYLWRTHTPRLMLAYVSMPDEMDHAWLGQARQDARYEPLRRWGYQLVDRAVETYVGFASANDHVVFVSDHGMTPVTHEARMNMALRDAGLVAVDARGQVDAARSKVLYRAQLPAGAHDRLEGRRRAARRARRRAGAGHRRPAGHSRSSDGQPVITGVFSSPADRERLGFGGPNGFDACFDARPGYMLGAWLDDGPVVRRRPRPTGEHGYLPTRPDMQGILIAAGPRIPKGGRWPVRKAIDVAPLVSDLLGVDPPRDARGQSPLRK